MKDVTADTQGAVPVPSKIHPLMSPEELKSLWRSVRARWHHDGEAMVRDIEAERDAWDNASPPATHG